MTDGHVHCFLSAGSNIGDRVGELRSGVAALAAAPGVEVITLSSLWESEYVGPGRQEPYLNGCLELGSALGPWELLALLQGIERARGRMPEGHMRPRPLDLDLLFFGVVRCVSPDLTLPHPRWRERGFVVAPLVELAPELRDPDSGQTVAAIHAKMRGAQGPWLRPWEGADWRDGLAKED